jgi:hypothetical protein
MQLSSTLLTYTWTFPPVNNVLVPSINVVYNQLVVGWPYLLPLVYSPLPVLNYPDYQVGCVFGVNNAGNPILYINVAA